jgi:hypothetical protein
MRLPGQRQNRGHLCILPSSARTGNCFVSRQAVPEQETVLCPARTTDGSVSWPAGIYQDKNGSMASRTPPGQVIGSLPCLAYFSHTFLTTCFSKFNVFMNPCFFHSLRKLRRYPCRSIRHWISCATLFPCFYIIPFTIVNHITSLQLKYIFVNTY